MKKMKMRKRWIQRKKQKKKKMMISIGDSNPEI